MTKAFGLLAVLSLVALGCSKSSRPHAERVAVESAEGLDVLGLTREQVSDAFKARLRAAKFVLLGEHEPAPASVMPWRIVAAVQAEEPDPEKTAGPRVAVVLSLHRKGSSESWETEGRARVKSKSNAVEEIQSAARESFEQALGRSVAECRALVEALSLSDGRVQAQLEGPDEAARDAAVQVLARRRNKAALPVLVSRLASDDLDVVHRAMGFVIELKDASSVPALIEASRGKDAVTQREIVFALGEIGGDEAEAYLFTLSQGHDDPLVRASAERALNDLKSRAQKATAPGATP